MKTNQEIIREGLDLARTFYASMGYEVQEGHRFDRATHPHERLCWYMAVVAYDRVNGTDLQSAIDNEDKS